MSMNRRNMSHERDPRNMRPNMAGDTGSKLSHILQAMVLTKIVPIILLETFPYRSCQPRWHNFDARCASTGVARRTICCYSLLHNRSGALGVDGFSRPWHRSLFSPTARFTGSSALPDISSNLQHLHYSISGFANLLSVGHSILRC